MTNTKQEAANEMEKRTRARQIDWAVYKFRSHFSLYELACLVHRLDPEAVNDDALYCFQIDENEVWRATALQGGNALVNAIWERPARFFLPPVGDTLERMKKAVGSALGLSISVIRARELIQSLGLAWPAELESKTTESQVEPVQPEQTPAPASAEQVEPVQAASTKARRLLKKRAMVDELVREWPTIQNDLKEAPKDTHKELKAANVSYGMWDVDVARAWAESKGKLVKMAASQSIDVAWDGGLIHRMRG